MQIYLQEYLLAQHADLFASVFAQRSSLFARVFSQHADLLVNEFAKLVKFRARMRLLHNNYCSCFNPAGGGQFPGSIREECATAVSGQKL